MGKKSSSAKGKRVLARSAPAGGAGSIFLGSQVIGEDFDVLAVGEVVPSVGEMATSSVWVARRGFMGQERDFLSLSLRLRSRDSVLRGVVLDLMGSRENGDSLETSHSLVFQQGWGHRDKPDPCHCPSHPRAPCPHPGLPFCTPGSKHWPCTNTPCPCRYRKPPRHHRLPASTQGAWSIPQQQDVGGRASKRGTEGGSEPAGALLATARSPRAPMVARWQLSILTQLLWPRALHPLLPQGANATSEAKPYREIPGLIQV